jgi:hypothetical protein
VRLKKLKINVLSNIKNLELQKLNLWGEGDQPKNKIDVKEFSRREYIYLGKKHSSKEIQKLKNNK